MYIPETTEKQVSRQCVSALMTEHVYNKTNINKSCSLQLFASIYQFKRFSQAHFVLTDASYFCEQRPQKGCQRSLCCKWLTSRKQTSGIIILQHKMFQLPYLAVLIYFLLFPFVIYKSIQSIIRTPLDAAVRPIMDTFVLQRLMFFIFFS